MSRQKNSILIQKHTLNREPVPLHVTEDNLFVTEQLDLSPVQIPTTLIFQF